MVEETDKIIRICKKKESEVEFEISAPNSIELMKESGIILSEIISSTEAIHIYQNATPGDILPCIEEALIYEALPLKTCYIARDLSTKRIIGVCFGRDFTHQLNTQNICKYEDILREMRSDLLTLTAWKLYLPKFNAEYNSPDTKVFRVQVLGVRKEYWGYGLGKILLNALLQRAKSLGYTLAIYEATNLFSMRLALHLRFRREFGINYEKYMEVGGNHHIILISYPFKGINQRMILFGKENNLQVVGNPAEEFVFLTLDMLNL